MKKLPILFCVIMLFCLRSIAQVGINMDGSQPSSSAILDVKSSNKGFLPPRMTTILRDAISLPDPGLTIYNTDCNDLQVFNGVGWTPMGNNGLLGIPESISGKTTPCLGESGVVYFIPTVTGATGYNWIVPAGTMITNGQGSTAITVNFGSSGGSVCVSALNSCWKSPVRCLDIFVGPPGMPLAGVHSAAKTSIVWNWNQVTGAQGYKWNTVNDYSTATDLGPLLANTESGLTCETVYTRFLWAYNSCTNSQATTLTQSTISCSGCGLQVIDLRNGKVYNTVQIGSQCWFRENIDIGVRLNGSQEQTNNGTIEKYCYNDLEANCITYGGLYQWGEVAQYLNGASNTTSWSPAPTGNVTGICPPGWHIPTDAEWCTASQALDPTVNCSVMGETGTDAGGKMKETGTIHWASPNTGATNTSGFTALPGGYRHSSGNFNGLTYNNYYWMATQSSDLGARNRTLSSSSAGIFRSNDLKTSGTSARCIMD